MQDLPRMRTLDGLFYEIQKLDPGSQVKKNFLYGLLRSGKIKTVMAGNKRLANLDEVLHYLANPPAEQILEPEQQYGMLRKIQ